MYYQPRWYIGCFVDFSQGFSFRAGDVFSLLSAVLFAGQIVAVGEMSRRIDHYFLVFMELSTSAILAALFFLLADGNFRVFINTGNALSVLYLGIVVQAFAFYYRHGL